MLSVHAELRILQNKKEIVRFYLNKNFEKPLKQDLYFVALGWGCVTRIHE